MVFRPILKSLIRFPITPLPDEDSEALAREVLATNSYYLPNVFFNTLKLRASSPRGPRCILSSSLASHVDYVSMPSLPINSTPL